MIIKSDSEWVSGFLFWVLEPFVKAINLLSESHFIFGITDMVQWKALIDRNYQTPRVFVIPGGCFVKRTTAIQLQGAVYKTTPKLNHHTPLFSKQGG